MTKTKKLGKPYLLLLSIFTLLGLGLLILLLFFGKERINIEIVEFRNITNQTFLQELFKSFNLEFYPLYAESYVVGYGIGNNKTNWNRAYISIFAFNDSNKANKFFNFAKNYRTNATGKFSSILLKNNKVMIVSFYENEYINYVTEKFKDE